MPTWLRVLILTALGAMMFVFFTLYRAFSQFDDSPIPGGPIPLGLLAAALIGLWYWVKRKLPKSTAPSLADQVRQHPEF